MATADALVLNDTALARRLFWDCEPAQIDLEAHSDFVIGRCLEYGTLVTVRWCLRFYGTDRPLPPHAGSRHPFPKDAPILDPAPRSGR
ncbi:MAG: hypothetical protein AB1486_33200 [Planctomycetota bacterium]